MKSGQEKKDKFIIFDETSGKSAKGKSLKWIASKYGIKYIDNAKDFLDCLKEGTK